MSHSTVMVLLPQPPTDSDHLEGMLSELLKPFCENDAVEPYKDRIGAPVPEEQREGPASWPWPYNVIVEDHPDVDVNDAALVAKLLNERWEHAGNPEDSSDVESYHADEEGLWQWSSYNPNSRWDWWVIGGRWTGYFAAKSGFTGQPGLMTDRANPGYYDCVRKGDIDMARMVAREIERATEYHEHVQAELAAGRTPWGDTTKTLEQRVAEAADNAIRPYAVLAEGVWREPGRMGWFGMSDATDDSSDEYGTWFAQFWSMIPDEAWLVVVDVHI